MESLVARTGRNLQRYNDGRRQVVGCVPYRYKEGIAETSLGVNNNNYNNNAEEAIEILVITPQRKGKGMLFPKGGWETDEAIEDAALRETMEEAGVLGQVQGKLGTWNFENNNNKKKKATSYEGHMFALLVKEQLDSWPEMQFRQRHWISVGEARNACKQWWMKEALESLVNRLSKEIKKAIYSSHFATRCGAQILPPPAMGSLQKEPS